MNQYIVKSKWSIPTATEGKILCTLCPHACVLSEGQRGICRSRAVVEGSLCSLVYGRACAVCVDPIEKKPLYHFLPGSKILSIATTGCNLRCPNCQNSHLSQVAPEEVASDYLPPQAVVELAKKIGAPSIAYTYTEPFIYYEYVFDTAKLAQRDGIKNVLVTAGYVNQEPLIELCPYLAAANVDLKSFDENFYLKYPKVKLQHILETLVTLKQHGVWLELTTLIIPTLSDDLVSIKNMCAWIVKELGAETPLHFSAFFPRYKLQELEPTKLKILLQARELALACGLKHVHLGNV
ncbi:MAG: AmmeMemoRadiSam system radical SAM enzyme [Deltaproteobacteria bacterium]|jgi:pyruvate formate lyase activating enzyme|nr:AmmeMemoRadiSam system radical SAM enzyme [Deltaproteobacteria bacterium]